MAGFACATGAAGQGVGMTPAAELKKLMQRPPVLTVAVAESVTGGHVQAMITAVSGASEYFRGGVTAYTLDEKVRILGVTRAPARRVDCVSQQVAVEMALGVGRLFETDLAVATTGYAQPAAAKGVKVPMAWWAICHRQGGGSAVVISGCVEVRGEGRVSVQHRVADTVLRELVKYVRELHPTLRQRKARRR
jgi:nicotinamide-nucleotide amidase